MTFFFVRHSSPSSTASISISLFLLPLGGFSLRKFPAQNVPPKIETGRIDRTGFCDQKYACFHLKSFNRLTLPFVRLIGWQKDLLTDIRWMAENPIAAVHEMSNERVWRKARNSENALDHENTFPIQSVSDEKHHCPRAPNDGPMQIYATLKSDTPFCWRPCARIWFCTLFQAHSTSVSPFFCSWHFLAGQTLIAYRMEFHEYQSGKTNEMWKKKPELSWKIRYLMTRTCGKNPNEKHWSENINKKNYRKILELLV